MSQPHCQRTAAPAALRYVLVQRPQETTSKKKGQGKTSTKRLASAFELAEEEERAIAMPSSTAPAVLQQPALPLATAIRLGLRRVKTNGDTYLP